MCEVVTVSRNLALASRILEEITGDCICPRFGKRKNKVTHMHYTHYSVLGMRLCHI